MFGQVDLPHPAGADLIEDQVAADLEALVLPGGELVGVELRDHARVNQAGEQVFGSGWGMTGGAQAIKEAVEPIDRHQPAAAKPLEEIGNRTRGGHGRSAK